MTGALALLLILDFWVLAPQFRKMTLERSNRLNLAMTNYMPIYSASSTQSLFSLRSDYFYKIELKGDYKFDLEPRNIGEQKFVGYSSSTTKLVIKCIADDPLYFSESSEELLVEWDLKPGKFEKTIPGKGMLKGKWIRITLEVKIQDMPIKITEPGLLWNSYEQTPVYFVTLKARRLRAVLEKSDT